MTKKHRNVAETLSRRAALLCAKRNKHEYATRYAIAHEIYDWRSKLMHGSISPSNGELSSICGKAAKLTRLTLLAGLDFFTVIEIKKPRATSIDLQKKYKQLEALDFT
jgi:hypothetical protein